SLFTFHLHAQPVFNKPHGLYSIPMLITISPSSSDSRIYYTTDGSEPTLNSTLYTNAFLVRSTTILRAAEFRADTLASPVTTCSYIYPASVLSQPNDPAGYPSRWGKYCEIQGTAVADYEMDPELASNPAFAQKAADGFYALPVLSLVTDKDNLFSTVADEKTGGIYIYTGAPVGGYPGRGWERPVSAELFGGTAAHDLQVDCALTIHGGHSRLPDKNPKHSFRLKFKSAYGPGKLHYPLYGNGEGEVTKFNSLIVRTTFNDSWVCQGNDRGRSQITKELWARLTQKRMGYPAANGIYVHLFLNGMYWGLYSLSERINDDFCQTHFGGDKEDYDVVKVTEDSNGQRLEASDGSIDKWNEMVSLAEKSADNQYYFRLTGQNGAEPLLDVDNFIDYMLINQYSGNEDWDYHNWTAIRNRKRADRGFQFLVWDAECIFQHTDFNALNTYYSKCTTHIFKYLIQNAVFRRRYIDRAYKLLVAPDGMLTEKNVVALWDSLYNDISLALYDESARWGDYRRDVHPYYSKGELYTPENHYMAERNKLLTEYFPQRRDIFLKQLIEKGWYPKTAAPVFLVNREECLADTLTSGDELTLSGTPAVLYTQDGSDPVSWIYSSGGTRTKSAIAYTKGTNLLDVLPKENGWVTVKAIVQSFQGWSPTVERSFYITRTTDIVETTDNRERETGYGQQTTNIYDTSGRIVPKDKLSKGIYIKNGRKTFQKGNGA
ncbi:MAG: CotH kinase family protein, partial [Bacteroidaceae bacterium]|nr:CotH kinase family protein [Bacteroidaceae bacterium]